MTLFSTGNALPYITGPIQDFMTTYEVPINIALIVIFSMVARLLLVLVITAVTHRVTHDASRRKDRIRKATELGEEPPKSFPLSPLATERVVQRTRALASLTRNIVTVGIATVALILILAQLHVNLTAVLASAGIVAAGLAFGAQNIVKDLLNGIFMVAEDQLGVGDVVKIGEVEGSVEVVGLRITQVRSYDGTLWFIRNGEILKLGNMSHGWGRAVLDVSVDPASDLDQVAAVLTQVAQTVCSSAQLAGKITGTPEVVGGLTQVSEDRVTVQLAVRTVPEAQGEVELALRKAIKEAFDQQGIRFAPERSAFVLRQNDSNEL